MTVVLLNPDDVTRRGQSEKNLVMFKNLGVKVLDTLFYKRDTTDYTPLPPKKIAQPWFRGHRHNHSGGPTLLIAKALWEVGSQRRKASTICRRPERH
jgi:hypothetical protein